MVLCVGVQQLGMVQLKEIVNSVFTSKSYIFYKETNNKAWLVGIGDVGPVVEFSHADKEQAQQSMERILRLAVGKTICSGHKVN